MKKTTRQSIARWTPWLIALACVPAHATNYSLWVHGRGGGATPGNYTDFRHWGPSSVNGGVNMRAVNWDGRSHIASENVRLRDALDCYCTGNNWCYVAAHSAGNLMVGYALDLYGGTARHKKTPSPNSSGQCTDSDGTTQVGWNIKWVDVAGGAAGGTELADLGAWALTEPLVSDLKTSTARAMYNHNNTRGKTFFMFAGAKGAAQSALLPGQDDSVIAYHSSGGVAGSSGGAYCNAGSWFCNDLTTGTGTTEGGHAKWTNHNVKFRDDGEAFTHTTGGNWGGIVSKMLADMGANAR